LKRSVTKIVRPKVSIRVRPVRRLAGTTNMTAHMTAHMTRKAATMRFMLMIKATAETEAGALPSEEILTAMGRYNEELVKAGVLLAGEGLRDSSKGARVRFSGTKRTVIDGPFAEAKELIAGFWLIQVGSKEEAVEWAKRCPCGDGNEIEIRQVFEVEDFGDAATPEVRATEAKLRAAVAGN
jgi:hypothetical protein